MAGRADCDLLGRGNCGSYGMVRATSQVDRRRGHRLCFHGSQLERTAGGVRPRVGKFVWA